MRERYSAGPACAAACPVSAIQRNPSSEVVEIDLDLCVKCKECITACPYKAIYFDDIEDKIIKCDLCGGDPKCVTAYKKEKNGPGWEAERKADRPLDPMKRKNVGRPKEIKTLEALSLLKEGYNEDEIAKIMSRKYGMKIFSSQISRWLKRDVLHPRNPKKRNRS